VNKTINLIGEDKKYTIIDGGSSGDVVHISADCVNISGFTLQNSGSVGSPTFDSGIDIRSNYNTITSNNALNNKNGIFLYYSSNNTITSNNASDNHIGIDLESFSNNNIITGNNASNNGYGIYLDISSNNNIITGNKANSNLGNGITIFSSSNNISGNSASNNENGITIVEPTSVVTRDSVVAGII